MRDTARWAFWRRFWYGTGFSFFWVLVGTGVYFFYIYEAPQCFDGTQNGEERGVDCGGACVRICAADVTQPNIRWTESFEVTEGQYNAVAYIENANKVAAAPEVNYKFTLSDDDGLIEESSGTTVLPPDSVYPIFLGRIQTGERVPTQTQIDLEYVDLWVPGTVGRGQFTVVDRKLEDADVRPRLEATIVNNALTEAKDVEIVATIFDARGNSLTSSRTFVEYFPPQAEEQVVFTWPEPIAKTVRSCEVPTDVVMAIDLSGSMNNDQDTPPEPISSVLNAAQSFVSRVQEKDQISLVTFATDAILNRTLTNDSSSIQNTILKLEIDPSEERGSTNTGDAFVRAFEEFSTARHNPNARKVMVILTDGLATAPDEDPEVYAKEKAALVKAKGVEVYAIGLGENVNMDFVRAIASNQNNAYQALSSNQVDRIYQKITGAICEDGFAVIDIIPKNRCWVY